MTTRAHSVALPSERLVTKRLLDLLGAIVGLVLTAPIWPLIVGVIRLDSPGPAFFSQHRIGRGGQRFRILKFRTMRVNGDAVLQRDSDLWARYVAHDCKLPPTVDPRITRVGRWLRSTSLDELPQFWNVLRGEMSLVGPRPMVGPELEHYGEAAALVLSVRPGLTGLWQVTGRSNLCGRERAVLDMQYVRNWTLRRDLVLLAKTVPAVLSRHGAL